MYDQMLREENPNFNFEVEFDDTSGETATLYSNFDQHLGVKPNSVISQEKIDQNLAKYQPFKIQTLADGSISGEPLDHPNRQKFLKTGILNEHTEEMLLDTQQVRDLGKAMLETAKFLRTNSLSSENRHALESAFIDATQYAISQGFTNGSGYQIVSHLGYQTRELFDSLFIMRQLISEHGLLKESQQLMMWFNASGRIYEKDEDIIDSNVDILNTQLQWMVKSFLLLPDHNERVAMLNQLQQWLSQTLLTSDGLGGGFKPDGSTFHHSQHYPAYGKDAFNGLSATIFGLGGSPYQITQPAHEYTKDALLKMRIYTKEMVTPIVLSGRHPTGEQKISATPYKWMALAGSPSGDSIDQELAAAYANLAKMPEFEEIPAEDEPVGVWAMNYSSTAISRGTSFQDPSLSWLAMARGFSRYLVGNETYEANNLYGRYLQYGQLELTPSDLSKRPFSHDGWDWNRFPGTTTIHLPNDELKATLSQLPAAGIEEMLLSTESYSGANALGDDNAMFAMKLHGHKKYEQQSLRARKSYFFFDDTIVALGSGVVNNESRYPTETTLFQHSVPNLEPIEINNSPENQLGTDTTFSSDTKFKDPAGNLYFVQVKGDETIRFLYQDQHSNAQNDGSPTQGQFATALINHGIAPEDSQYEYAVRVEPADEIEPNYTVIQHDNKVHAVRGGSGVESFAFFEAATTTGTHVLAADTPSQVMTQITNGRNLSLSIVNPDLAIYTGTDPDQVDENGEQVEVSIYSRPWRYSLSQPVQTTITVKGHWQLNQPGSQATIRHTGENTEVTVKTTHATPERLSLTPST